MDEWFRISYRQKVAHVRDVHLPYLSVEYGPCFRGGIKSSRDYFTHRILWLHSIQLNGEKKRAHEERWRDGEMERGEGRGEREGQWQQQDDEDDDQDDRDGVEGRGGAKGEGSLSLQDCLGGTGEAAEKCRRRRRPGSDPTGEF